MSEKIFNFVHYLFKPSEMSFLRAILCIICPPLAVLDKGCGSILLVAALTLCAWVPGVIGAILICTRSKS